MAGDNTSMRSITREGFTNHGATAAKGDGMSAQASETGEVLEELGYESVTPCRASESNVSMMISEEKAVSATRKSKVSISYGKRPQRNPS